MQDKNSNNNISIEELDLLKILRTVVRNKLFIVLFSFTITLIVLLYMLMTPNVYSSRAVLIPQNENVGGLSGLSAMASFAGVNVGDAQMTPDQAYTSLLNNYAFMRSFVINNNLTDVYFSKNFSQNYVFAFGFRSLYDLTHFTPVQNEEDPEEDVYAIVKNLQMNVSISSDKKSGLITISFRNPNRFLTEKILNFFLKQSSRYLIENNLITINRKLKYYQEELGKADGFELRKNISNLISKLVEEKITIKSSQYFQTELLIKPEVAFIKNKDKPSRGIILIMSLILSLVVAVLIVFIREILFGNVKDKTNVT